MKLTRSILQVCPVLPQDVQQQLLALEEAQLLNTAVTSFAYAGGGCFERLLRLGDALLACRIIERTGTRRLPSGLRDRTHAHGLSEVIHRVRRWRHQTFGPAATDAWFQAVDQAAAERMKPSIRIALGREDACLSTFATAKAMGNLCLYDLPIAYHETVRRMLETEQAEFPHAAQNLDLNEDYAAGRCRRKKEEVLWADHILVPSRFVAESLTATGVGSDRISVIPFGCEVNGAPATKNSRSRQRIILNIGQLSLRKGIPRLLRAWKRLGAHRTDRLRLVGHLHLNERFIAAYSGVFEHVPQVPRKELRKHYESAYAFVMPSAAEGLAVVITEALGHGLPVVASGNSGAAGFMTDGQEGLIYPFEDDEQLCMALDRLLSRPAETAEMGRAAYRLAQRWTWAHYRSAFRSLVLRLLEARPRLSC